MSKSEKIVILPSEADGWEVWSQRADVVKHVKSLDGAVGKSDAQPGACVAFSVCRVATIPLLVPSDDVEEYRGAAQLELESSGLLMDEAYQGWDCIPVEKSDGKTFVSAIYLLEEELNAENDLRHYSFDFSARFYSPNRDGDCIALWKERHTWCLAFYRNNVPFFIEPLGSEVLNLGMTISLLCSQLAMKGIAFHPHELLLWSSFEDVTELEKQLASANLLLHQEPRPVPSFPTSTIELQPSAVSEWEKRVRSMMRLRVVLMAVAALYLIAGVVLWWKNHQQDQKIAKLENEIAQFAPSWQSNQDHFAAWDELSPVVTPNWPLRLFKECVMAIPGGQPIRFTEINVQQGFIQIKGNATTPDALNRFKPKLRKSDVFEEYEWELGQPKQSSKTRLWEFQFNAKPVGYEGY
ncbi:PilN domain-containing protein [Rubritalea tangerina]|uniref:PilN domain-containing protein n=1 Tax=Rubritalea tangerina TaxID=430798 RepID=A0ABW4ZAN3_9BACT